ncbi:hypothetical protein [Kibdelosporangium aridum]|uniref:hypothetical protein n=1 Tax=Kibdelosporangium aridum TaxID=2030 RepID=UPI0005276E56
MPKAGSLAEVVVEVLAAIEDATGLGEPGCPTCAALRDHVAAAAPVLLVVDDVDLADRRQRHVLRCCASRLSEEISLLLR